jgi:archaemetzincin
MMHQAPIALIPVGEVSSETVAETGPILANNLNAQVVIVPRIPLVASAYDTDRRQYHSTPILDALARAKRREWERLLGVVDVDLYAPELNFVFGEADSRRGVAVFSLARLRPGRSSERAHALFLKRAATEAIHELGHTYGLGHCRDRDCVMWFSNTLAESDRKGLAFCAAHAAELAAARSDT